MYFKHLANNEWKSDNNNINEMKNSLKISFIGIYIGNKWMHWICRYPFRNIYDCYYIICKSKSAFAFIQIKIDDKTKLNSKKGNNNLFSRLKIEKFWFLETRLFFIILLDNCFSHFSIVFLFDKQTKRSKFFSPL